MLETVGHQRIDRKQFIIDAIIRAQSRRSTMETSTLVVEAPVVKKLFPTKAAYLAMKAQWARSSHWDRASVVLYNLLRGKNPRNGFTSVTNKVKLANGARPDFAYQQGKALLKWNLGDWNLKNNQQAVKAFLSHFGPTVTLDIANEALKGLE